MQVSPTSYPPVQQYPPTQQYVQTQPYMVSPHQQYMPMQGYPQTQVQYVTIPMGGGAPVAFAPGMVQMQPGVPGTQVVQQAPMKRPPMETVNRLVSARGAMVWQETRIGTVVADVMDVAYAARNKYRISALPQDKSVKSDPDDPKGWTPTEREFTSMETLIKAKEDSDCMVRILTMWCGCGNLRPMKIHYDVPDSGEAYTVIRPFKLGGHYCCPLEMNLFRKEATAPEGKVYVGRVREDYSPYCSKCCAAWCKATSYFDIETPVPGDAKKHNKRFTLRANLSCCGRTNNCCGATCCKDDAVYDILDDKGEIVAHLQKTYAPGPSACCRWSMLFDNYMISFPDAATPDERMLLVTSVLNLDYFAFERKGKESNGSGAGGMDIS